MEKEAFGRWKVMVFQVEGPAAAKAGGDKREWRVI